MGILTIVVLVIVLAIVICVLVIIDEIKKSRLSQMVDMVMQADVDYDNTPKSVSGGDSLFLPRVLGDYPDFDIEKAKAHIETTISLMVQDITKLEGNARISAQKFMLPFKGRASELRIHNTVISNYIKSSESATIKFQTSFQLRAEDKLKQERIEVDYTLFYKGDSDETVSFNCDNCGAPLKSLNTKSCEYCGNGIAFMQERVWIVNNITKK